MFVLSLSLKKSSAMLWGGGLESSASIQIALVEFSSDAQMFSFLHDAWFTFATWWKVFTIRNKTHWNLLIVTNDIKVSAEKLAHENHTG